MDSLDQIEPDELARPGAETGPTDLTARYAWVRHWTDWLSAPLSAEDQQAQSMPDASPAKWHRAHTTWFFETFLLKSFVQDYQVFHTDFNFLFNSYYEAVGERQFRPERGLLTRPSASLVDDYRAYVDRAMTRLLNEGLNHPEWAEIESLTILGLNHEQQHQELLLTDILHLFSRNAVNPVYMPLLHTSTETPVPEMHWVGFDGGLQEIGHQAEGFAFDNEGPVHKVWLEPYKLGNRLVTNGEWLEFIKDGGYETPSLWLSDGLAFIRENEIRAPLYWREADGAWEAMTLRGLQSVNPAAPVTHVSFYEAEAFARWSGCRLPTEPEWEAATTGLDRSGCNLMTSRQLMPMPADPQDPGLQQVYGDCWEWTNSAYLPYPGFKPSEGAVGEYNGKFMCNQMVLKGGSCATPGGHIRASYRNFFYPHHRWQFSGLRLAEDA